MRIWYFAPQQTFVRDIDGWRIRVMSAVPSGNSTSPHVCVVSRLGSTGAAKPAAIERISSREYASAAGARAAVRRAVTAVERDLALAKGDQQVDDGREELERIYGTENVHDTAEMTSIYTVESFLAPCVIVTRKSDGARGTLEFQHRPRYYFNFVAERIGS